MINREHPIGQPIAPDFLVPLSSVPAIHALSDGILLERTSLRQLAALLEACQGMNEIIAVSGYRTKSEQERIYASSLAEHGAEYTARYVAWPDRSEHQTGLAIDVGKLNKDVDFIAPAFPDIGVCKRFKQLAARYGFIQRYKEGKESLTRISCEPWHFRYVGYPHAEIMERNDWCLEEYIDVLEDYPFEGDHLVFEDEWSTVEIYYAAASAGTSITGTSTTGTSTTIPLVECDRYDLSGNNRNGFIVTAFRDKGLAAYV